MRISTYFLISTASILAAAVAPAGVILDTSYTSAQGYSNGNLQFQQGWLGQNIAQVSTAGAGTVSSNGGPFDRNAHGTGARGGAGGVPNGTGTFATGEILGITFDYQFELSGEGNRSLCRGGFRNEGPNAGNGFESNPQQGFKLEYNQFDSGGQPDDGNVKFFPDLNATGNSNALILEGSDVGIFPGGGVLDFVSDRLRIEYEAVNTGPGTWEVQSFTVTNLDTATTYPFTGPTQTFTYSDPDAFFAQQLAQNGDAGFTGTTGGVVFRYDLPPAPGLPPHGLTMQPSLQDLDGNGLPDIWEALFGAAGLAPGGDDDGDGATNLEEAIAGTNPFDPASVLSARVEQSGATQGVLCWPVLEGRPGQAESSPDLGIATPFADHPGSPVMNGGEWELTFDLNETARFFRVRSTEDDLDNDGVPDWLEPHLGFLASSATSASQDVSYDTDGNGSPDTTLDGDLAAFNEIYRRSEPGTRPTRAQAARFVLQASFGAKDMAEVDHAANIGYEAWIDEQVALPINYTSPYILAIKADWDGSAPDPSLAGYASNATIVFGNNFMTPWARNAIGAPDQLRQRVAWALSQILVASRNAAMLANQPQAIAHYYDQFVDEAFGNYEDLVNKVARHPVMGHYLSHLGNQKEDLSIDRFPDENFARELMQLFTIGLWELNLDGSRKLDGGLQPIPTYGNLEITQLAKVFTGIHYDAGSFGGGYRDDAFFMTSPMKLFPAEHDFTAKTVVTGNGTTHTIPARSATEANAVQDIEDAVYHLVRHPNTGPFIGRALIQFLVTANPSSGYVQRVATIFQDNGSGVVGDMEAVVRAILLDDEARNPMEHLATPYFGKLREPLVRTMHLSRILKLDQYPGLMWWDWSVYHDDSLQEPMHSPSVFNYYRPDFRLPGELAQNQLDSPVFGFTDSYSAISFPNRLWIYCSRGFKENGYDFPEDLSDLEALAGNIPDLLDHLSLLYCGGTLGASSRATITTALQSTANLEQRARLAAYIVLMAPEGSCLK